MICSPLSLYKCVKGVQTQAIVPKTAQDIKKWVPRLLHYYPIAIFDRSDSPRQHTRTVIYEADLFLFLHETYI